MKKSFLLLVMAYFWLAGVFAQTGAIVNLEVAQRTDGSGLVDIHFDLNGAGASYNLQFEASFDDGVNYEPLSETFLTGELINVLPGTGKHIIWEGKASHPETFSTQTRVRVIAIEKTTFECGDPLIDQRDGNNYATVQIGNQCWMAENLNIGSRINGNQEMTDNGIVEKYCYENDEANCNVYGGLYQWNEMMNYNTIAGVQGICPDGWHLPTNADWTSLTTYVSSQPAYLCNSNTNWIAKALAAKTNWNNSSCECCVGNNLNTNNATSFTALPGGCRNPDGTFNSLRGYGYWWSSSHLDASNAWYQLLYYTNAEVIRFDYGKSFGFSMRCIKDDSYSSNIPDVTTSPIINITATTATSGGNVTDDGGAPVTSRGVVWSTTPNPTLEENEGFTEDGEGLGDFTSEITGSPNMTYYVRAYATNSVGTTYGENVSFKAASVNPCPDMPTVTDIDGNEYNTVLIGTQCWMAENLNIGTMINGASNQTNNGLIEKYCYDNTEANCDVYGGLYQWDEMMGYITIAGVQGICPDGWHLPTDDEWCTLEQAVDPTIMCISEGLRGVDGGGKLKEVGTTHWNNPNNGATNSSGFTALPGGYHFTDVSFNFLGNYGYFWSSSEISVPGAWCRMLVYNDAQVSRSYGQKSIGFSVRCLKDDGLPTNQPPSPPSNPLPETGSINQLINTTLTWTCSDPEGDPLTYDVYYGTEPNPALVASVFSGSSYTPVTQQYSTTYFWKIVAHDDEGNSTEGEVWSFTTIDEWQCGDLLIDTRNGQEYTTVQIGEQCWMAENLNIGTRINGNQAMTDNSNIEKYCYDNSETNCDLYGGLYQWNEMMGYTTSPGVQGICPAGWHIPSQAEWIGFTSYVSNQPLYLCHYNTNYIAKALASTTYWYYSSNTCAVGNNRSNNNLTNFSALPGGYRNYNSSFNGLVEITAFWSSTEYSTLSMVYFTATIGIGPVSNYSNGLSVRCLRD